MKRKHSDNMKLLANIDFSSIQMLKFYEFAGFSCALMMTNMFPQVKNGQLN